MIPLLFPLCVHSLDKLLHSGCACLFYLVSYMTVNIQGKGCCGVSEIFLHSFYIVAGFDTGNSLRVPQIVETGVRSPSCVQLGSLVTEASPQVCASLSIVLYLAPPHPVQIDFIRPSSAQVALCLLPLAIYMVQEWDGLRVLILT